MNLRDLNYKTIDKYKQLENVEDLAYPLLVSSKKEYLEDLKSKILYIGQETNGWINYNENTVLDIDVIEDRYYEFLNNNTNNKEYWRFIKEIINNEMIVNNVLWSNTLIAGKKYDYGTPKVTDLLKSISYEYILNLIDIINPEKIIFVSGPRNPYYEIVTKILNELGSTIASKYPNSNELLIEDDKNKIYYTYHPNYLQRKGQLKNIATRIKF